ncbi:MAG: mechanosensitive ion channel family protein [Actinomycetia bacterium]|nr:mechanosensitive ion channel family protein [Actinomycetes bacterium]
MRLFGAELTEMGTLAVCVAGGALVGAFIDILIVGNLYTLARKRSWKAWAIVLKGVSRFPIWWAALAGGALALNIGDWNARLAGVVERGLLVVAGVTITIAATRIAVGLVRGYAVSAEGPLPSTTIFVNLTRVAVVLVGAMLILNALGISITPVLTALGVGGLAVALALQDTLSNLFAGLQIVVSRQIRPRDYLLLEGGQEGTVEDVTWRYTTLRTPQDNLVIVPNAKLAQTIVTNFVLPEQPLSVSVEFGVPYGADLERVEAVVADVASEVMRVLQPAIEGWEPVVRFKALGDSQVQTLTVLRAAEFSDQFVLRSEFIKRVHARFAEEGLDFATPVRTVHVVHEDERGG